MSWPMGYIIVMCFLLPIGGFFQSLCFAFVQSEWMLYLGVCVSFLDHTTWAMIRSVITKLVPPNEYGSILSFMCKIYCYIPWGSGSKLFYVILRKYFPAAIQAFVPLVSSPIFGNIYRSTVETMPNTFMLIIAGLFLVNVSMLIYVDRGLLRVPKSREENEKTPKTISETKETSKEDTTAAWI